MGSTEKPQLTIILTGQLATFANSIREKTGISSTALVKLSLVEWAQKHAPEVGFEKMLNNEVDSV